MNVAAHTRLLALSIATLLLSLLGLAMAGNASATVTCDLVAAPNGSDSAPGTVTQPLRSVQRLADALAPGQTGCLRTGNYSDPSDDEVNLGEPGVTLTSYPGERATVKTRLWVEQTGDGVTISDLNLNGRNPTLLPSPTINADDVVLRDNDITNDHTAICVSLGSAHTWGRAHRTLVEGNAIHDCGALPAQNSDHGIYVNSSDDAIIRDNWIYDNADRGIQLYPDAQGTLVTGNVIDGNGQGVIFGGSEESASSNNIVENNVITNSKIRDNVESSWGGPIGKGNIARNNCVGGGKYDEGDGGVLAGPADELGFKAIGNTVRVPAFANAAAGDFSIPSSDPCAGLLGGVRSTAGAADSAESEVTLDADRRKVPRMTPIRLTGSAPGATSVVVVVRKNGAWKKLGVARTRRSDSYTLRVRLPHPGRRIVKAEAGGLRDSRALNLRIKR